MTKTNMLDLISPTPGLECHRMRLASTREKTARRASTKCRWIAMPPSARRDAPVSFAQAQAQRIARRKRMVEEADAKRANPRLACSVFVGIPPKPSAKQIADTREDRNIRKRDRRARAGNVKPRVRKRTARRLARIERAQGRAAEQYA